MKVMSYNVLCGGEEGHYWSDRKEDVISVVRSYMPDVFGIQEAHLNWMKIFWENMPEYDYVGAGRDDGKEGGEFSPVFYRKDKFELLDKGWFWISETPEVPSKSWNTACIRICSYAKLKCRKTGKEFIAMNTHLDHVSVLARKKGVELINSFVKKFDCPVFITGDFNIPEKTDCYPDMINAGFFKDTKYCAEETEDKNTFHDFYERKNICAVIDFVFISDGFRAKSYHVADDRPEGRWPSDHDPVVVELCIE